MRRVALEQLVSDHLRISNSGPIAPLVKLRFLQVHAVRPAPSAEVVLARAHRQVGAVDGPRRQSVVIHLWRYAVFLPLLLLPRSIVLWAFHPLLGWEDALQLLGRGSSFGSSVAWALPRARESSFGMTVMGSVCQARSPPLVLVWAFVRARYLPILV